MKRIKANGTLEKLITLIDTLSERKDVDNHELNRNISRFSKEFYADNVDSLKEPTFTKHLGKRMNVYLYDRLSREYSQR